MAIHYGIGADQVACGRNNHNLVSVKTPDGVTCKTCQKTEAHRAAAADAEVSKAVVGLQVIAGIQDVVNPPKYGRNVVAATQTLPDIQRQEVYRRQTAAFEEWRKKLNYSDRLPRGRYFKGKKPGRKVVVMDELWRAFSSRKHV
jgi:hypothetical protein